MSSSQVSDYNNYSYEEGNHILVLSETFYTVRLGPKYLGLSRTPQ